MSPSLNIILFGETGVGKSSVINLISGSNIAKTSPDVQGCTMSFTPYNFEVDRRTFHIWDTVGLDEPEMGVNGYVAAIKQARDLIQNLSDRKGVDLLLFCIRGGRVTATVQSNYRLFFEVLCGSKVPVGLVITHLERENDMEGWWDRNQGDIQKYGIKAAGHACVTGLPNHRKSKESRENILELLRGRDGADRYNMPPDKWYAAIYHFFKQSPALKDLKRKEIVKLLVKRCKLDQNVAEELAIELEEGNQTAG